MARRCMVRLLSTIGPIPFNVMKLGHFGKETKLLRKPKRTRAQKNRKSHTMRANLPPPFLSHFRFFGVS